MANSDDPRPYELLVSCPYGLSPTQVSIVLNESYDRIPHPDSNLEMTISEIWDRRVEQNTSLFNGKKFRYGGHILHGGDSSSQDAHLCLHLGLTDYRTFVGTNLNLLWEKFLIAPEEDPTRCRHTSSPLGNGAVVETSDKKILVLQRSNNVGEFPGHFVFPGGHPEPQEVGVVSHQYETVTNSEHVSSKVSQEMFDSIIREVVEEIGVPSASLCNPVFIGISRRVLNVRPTAFFFIKCTLQSNEIQHLYSSAQDGYESTHLYSVSRNDLEDIASKMPGCHQGGFALYKLMIKAVENI